MAVVLLALSSAHAHDRQQAEGEVLAIMDRIEARVWFGMGSSGVGNLRGTIADLDETKALVRHGKLAGALLKDRFIDPPAFNRDCALSLYAYVIERTDHVDAIDELEAYLSKTPFEDFWTPHFAARALYVLKGLDDPYAGRYPQEYTDEEILAARDHPSKR
jgi:hypothetical protein